jgi:hypothetical protein
VKGKTLRFLVWLTGRRLAVWAIVSQPLRDHGSSPLELPCGACGGSSPVGGFRGGWAAQDGSIKGYGRADGDPAQEFPVGLQSPQALVGAAASALLSSPLASDQGEEGLEPGSVDV